MPSAIEHQLSAAIVCADEYLAQSGSPDSAPVSAPLSQSDIAELSDFLYQGWYIRQHEKHPDSQPPFTSLTQAFRSAHRGSYQWQPGWRVSRVSRRGRIVASRAGRERQLAPGDYIAVHGPGVLPKPGAEIEVVARLDSTTAQYGFWISYSSAWETSTGGIVRLYWNLDPEGGMRLVEQVSSELADEIPYSLKLPLEQVGYRRADVAVLYFPSDLFATLMPRLQRIQRSLQTVLYDHTPRLTRRLAPGLGLAEDPPEEQESFGMNRCRLVAEALSAEAAAQRSDPVRRLQQVIDHLVAAGLDPCNPHLNPGSPYDYPW